MNLIEILKNLVRLNTIRDRENNLIIDFIENYLQGLGFKTKRVDKCLVAKNDDNPKIGFIGHTDTVDYNTWDGNPFEIVIKDNKIFGLGVCDMKGGIAAILSALSKIDLDKNKIALYFTYDEETSFKGIKALKNEMFPKTVIIGEPTDNIPIYGTKGVLELLITFNGVKTHSSTPEKGKNAIYESIDFINKLREYYGVLKQDKCLDFEVPYTSMNVGMIKGGETVNSVPGKCEVSIEFRISKNEHLKKVEADVKELLKGYDATIEIKNRKKPKLNLDDMTYLENISNKKKTANYLTEASFIDSSAIIIGPGPITAHEKNEYITIDSLEKTEKLYIEIINEYSGKELD
jgi:acetylornithine deacetylase